MIYRDQFCRMCHELTNGDCGQHGPQTITYGVTIPATPAPSRAPEVEALTAKLAAAEGKIAAEEEACRALAARVSELEAIVRRLVEGSENINRRVAFAIARLREDLATAEKVCEAAGTEHSECAETGCVVGSALAAWRKRRARRTT